MHSATRAGAMHARNASRHRDYNDAMNVPPPASAQAFDALVERIDAILPQTQCRRCGYPACRPYAEAIGRGDAPINRCPPGGAAVLRALARLTGQPEQPIDPACGAESPPRVALIDEAACIGCTKCIQACPVDAIVGTGKWMHTVVADLCTGCELCLAPCPVDCITMIPAPVAAGHATSAMDAEAGTFRDHGRADAARARFNARNARLAREREARAASRKGGAVAASTGQVRARTIGKAEVLAAIARGRARKARRMHGNEPGQP